MFCTVDLQYKKKCKNQSISWTLFEFKNVFQINQKLQFATIRGLEILGAFFRVCLNFKHSEAKMLQNCRSRSFSRLVIEPGPPAWPICIGILLTPCDFATS